ncbi:alpha/beta hydrolase [Candidatus Woesearchaeota archaeon]|nr:alpha/beta hydrolase [Candidatus Woesearchaeota archaeon]
MEKKAVSFDDVLINYRIRKRFKTCLVFLHGLGGDLAVWEKYLRFFGRKGYSTLAVDYRGHGMSGRPNKRHFYALDNFSRDLHFILESEGVSDFVLIGHCFGGIVAINFQKLFPNKAKAYILIDTTFKAPTGVKMIAPTGLHKLLNLILEKKHLGPMQSRRDFEAFKGTTCWSPRRIWSDISNTSFNSWFFSFQNFVGLNSIGVLKSIKVPCLVIVGGMDTVFPIPVSRIIHKHVKHSKFAIIPEANHMLVINNFEAVKKKILGFLAQKGL